jgi:CRISPR-associated protein Cmr1
MTMKELEVQFETLTPLWTGGPRQNSDRLRETGLIGSLRWWYEVTVRGLGKKACDPTSETPGERCSFDSDAYAKAKRQGKSEKEGIEQGLRDVCPACRLFGCTRWGRLFRFVIEDNGDPLFSGTTNIKPTGRRRGWFYKAGRVGTIQGHLLILRGEGAEVRNKVLIPMMLAANWGGLGAKVQHGYGVVKVTARCEGEIIKPDVDGFLAKHPLSNIQPGRLPALNDLFFAKFKLKKQLPSNWWLSANAGITRQIAQKWKCGARNGSIPIAPSVKNQLRYVHPLAAVGHNLDYVFGTIRKGRQAAKLNISNVYQIDDQWEFRIWGWLPRAGLPSNFNRDSFLEELYQRLTTNRQFWKAVFGDDFVNLNQTIWREQGSPGNRCLPSCQTPCQNGAEFLRCLLC